jgi:hypothetical protein
MDRYDRLRALRAMIDAEENPQRVGMPPATQEAVGPQTTVVEEERDASRVASETLGDGLGDSKSE